MCVLDYGNKRYKYIFVHFQPRIETRQIADQHLLERLFLFLAHLRPLHSDVKELGMAIKQNNSTPWRHHQVDFLLNLCFVLLESMDVGEDRIELSIIRLDDWVLVHEFDAAQTVDVHQLVMLDVFEVVPLDLFLVWGMMSPFIDL